MIYSKLITFIISIKIIYVLYYIHYYEKFVKSSTTKKKNESPTADFRSFILYTI